MRAHFLLLLPLCRFYFLVHSFPINHKLANLDSESAPEVTNEIKQSNTSKLIEANGEDLEEMLRTVLENYDMRFPPNFGQSPTRVRIALKVLSVPLFREEDLRLTLELEMTQKWQDERLRSNTTNVMDLSPQLAAEIWQPNTVFEETRSIVHSAFHYYQSFHLHPNGTVVHTSQLTLYTHCPFFRQDYPFDRRACKISIGSGSYSTKTVVYEWEDVSYPVQFLAVALELLTEWMFPYFRLYDDIKVSDGGAKFSRITLQLYAARKPAHIIMSFVIPLGVLVILNWIPTYFIDNWAPRIISGVGMLAVTIGMIHQRPSASIDYDTSLDYYCYISFFLASSCLVQSAVALCLRNAELLEAEETREARVERRPGGKGVFASLRQWILKNLPCLEQWRPQEIELEVDLEAAVPDRELSSEIRQDNEGSQRNSSKCDRVFHTCILMATIVSVVGLSTFNILRRRSSTTQDRSLIDTGLAMLNSTVIIRRSYHV